jgi:telomerase reverse transcriptase
MHAGFPDYGVTVRMDKTLTNFPISIDGRHPPRLPTKALFPYGGTLVNTRTLEVSKDRARKAGSSKASFPLSFK